MSKQSEVSKLREKYKDRLAKSKKKSYGGIITLLVFVILIGAGFSYFKFIYETPESKELRQKIGKLEVVFRGEKEDWEENKIATNELMKINDRVEDLFILTNEKIQPKEYDDVRKEYVQLSTELENIKMDLPKAKAIPELLNDLKDELHLFGTEIKKPSKKEKESLKKANQLMAEAEKKLEEAKSIEDLDIIFLDIQEVKGYMLIFKTKLQIKEAEWKVETSNVEGNILDAESVAKKMVNWIECYSKINKLWKELKAGIDTSKVISKREFNLKNLQELQKQNKLIENKFKTIFKTVAKLSKNKVGPDLPCKAITTKKNGTNTEPAQKDIVVPPVIKPETFKPAIVDKSIFTGGETSAQLKFEVIIDEEGNVSEPKLTEGSVNPAVDQAAEEAVMKYKFDPGKDEDGKPGKCRSTVPVMVIGK